MITINVFSNEASLETVETLTSGLEGAKIKFNFSEHWNELQRTAVFKAGSYVQNVQQAGWEGDTVTIPPACLYKSGVELYVGVHGMTSWGTIIIPTIYVKIGMIESGASIQDYPEPISPNVLQQVINNMGELSSLTTTAKNNLVAAINEVLGTTGFNIKTLTTEDGIADADFLPFHDDSVDEKRKTSWSNIKSKLKAYFDTLYDKLPVVSSSDNGKVLKVINGVWSKGEASEKFVVTFTVSSGTYSANKTIHQIYAAYADNKIIEGVLSTNSGKTTKFTLAEIKYNEAAPNTNDIICRFIGTTTVEDTKILSDLVGQYTAATEATAWSIDLTSVVTTAQVSAKYTKPVSGIPSSDLDSAVQASLVKANSALQSVPSTFRTSAEQDVIDNAKVEMLTVTFSRWYQPIQGMNYVSADKSVQEIYAAKQAGKIIVGTDGECKYDLISTEVNSPNVAFIFCYRGKSNAEVYTTGTPTTERFIVGVGSISGSSSSWTEINESLASAAQVNAKYAKPNTGIPASDMASEVQTALNKANSALQAVPNTYRTSDSQDAIDVLKVEKLKVTFTSGNNNTISSNKTLAEIFAAYASGKIVIGTMLVTATDHLEFRLDEFEFYANNTITRDMKCLFTMNKLDNGSPYTVAIVGSYSEDTEETTWTYSLSALATTSDVNAKYSLPSSGIPLSDLSSAVRASLALADSALQDSDVEEAEELTLAAVATSGDYNDLINKPTKFVVTFTVSSNTITADKTIPQIYAAKQANREIEALLPSSATSYSRLELSDIGKDVNNDIDCFFSVLADAFYSISIKGEHTNSTSADVWTLKGGDIQPAGITDSGSYFVATTVEGALQEIGACLATKQAQHMRAQLTIATTDWTAASGGGYTCTKNVTGVTADNDIFCDISKSGVDCSDQGEGTLTFTSDSQPTEEVTVKIFIFPYVGGNA